jgi:hypothetical protein
MVKRKNTKEKPVTDITLPYRGTMRHRLNTKVEKTAMKKWMPLSILIFVICFSGTKPTYSQRLSLADTNELQIIYSHERMGAVVAHTGGLGVGYKWGKNTTAFKTRVISAEFVSFKSPKQIKTINTFVSNAKRYVYGKLNDVFFLRAGVGNKQLLNRKPLWGGVELRWIYEGGGVVAFEKPYYLFVFSFLPGNINDYIIESKQFDPDFHSWDDIYGKAPFTKGLNEISIKPGLYAKTAFNFEFGEVRTRMQALEAGFILEFFPQGVTIMADDSNNRLFWSFYLSLAIGKRFNKY